MLSFAGRKSKKTFDWGRWSDGSLSTGDSFNEIRVELERPV
jgi:hypothetical protein